MLLYMLETMDGVYYVLESLEVMRCVRLLSEVLDGGCGVLLCLLAAMEGVLYLLGMPDSVCCVLLCMPETVEGENIVIDNGSRYLGKYETLMNLARDERETMLDWHFKPASNEYQAAKLAQVSEILWQARYFSHVAFFLALI
jgi:hypothetical protein